jgi:sugar (pentulose or hexulose) kinase
MSRGMDILALDVGTSGLKAGVFGPDLSQRASAARDYAIDLNGRGRAEVDPEVWWSAIRAACAELGADLDGVEVMALSVTTPGLTPMAADGRALGPAILFLDGRSHEQAAAIRERVGEARFLELACNLPVSGGSSLASILWIRDREPATWDAAAMFGHTNTYLARRLTGEWAIDPSTTSITGLYATARHDLTWNEEVLEASGLAPARLPRLMRSYDAVGRILPEAASELGLPRDVVVLCGGNDATLAAWSGGLSSPGDANIISGTCDIASVCTDRPVASPEFNVRAHVLPGRWLTFFVLNTGGIALDWFHRTFCRELDADAFYGGYLPATLEAFLDDLLIDERETRLPSYVPYLGGSRYSLEPLAAAFGSVTLQTTREDLLLAVVRGNLRYLGEHLEEVARLVPVNRRLGISGGAARIGGMLRARQRWTGPFEYVYQDQSSLLGAAMLGQLWQAGGSSAPDRATADATGGIGTGAGEG